MSSKAHSVRVRAVFEFVGMVETFDPKDPEAAQKAVKERFKFFTTDIRGFIEEKRELQIATAEISVPDL